MSIKVLLADDHAIVRQGLRLLLGKQPDIEVVAEGKSTKQIASELYVSPKTVEANRRQVMEKLNIHSVAELTKYAVREGLTTLGQ